MDRHSPEHERQAVGGELIIPIAAVAFTLYYVWSILESPWEAQVNAFFVGSILIALVAVFLLKTIGALRAGRADLRLGALGGPAVIMPKRMLLAGLTLGYVVLIGWGGFTLTTFAFLFGAMYVLNEGRRPALILGLALALALVGYLVFIVAFQTRFPAGPFEWLMAAVL